MAAPVIFQDKETIYYADTCEPLKAAARRDEVYLRGWARGSYPGVALPPDVLPQVRSVGVWDAARPQSWGLALHCNEGIEFTYVLRGKTAFEVDGKTWQLRQGNLTVTRPWQFHRVGDPAIGMSRLVWLIIDVDVRRPNQLWRWPPWLLCTPAELCRLTELLRHNEQPVWQASAELAACFAKIDALLASHSPAAGQTRLSIYINELIVSLLAMLECRRIPLNSHLSTTLRTVELFLEELPKHVDHRWSLAEMAGKCGLSRSQFSSYCRQITNMTPVEYLQSCRMSRASLLLLDRPDLSVTEVAYRCGFNSSQYFATVFCSAYGCTPSAYRQQGRQKVGGD